MGVAATLPELSEWTLPSVYKPTHILLQKPQFHALMTNFGVLNKHKVQK